MNIFQRKIDNDFNVFEILIWWEKRRILYNAIMFILSFLLVILKYL
jgi:hypothetical protein